MQNILVGLRFDKIQIPLFLEQISISVGFRILDTSIVEDDFDVWLNLKSHMENYNATASEATGNRDVASMPLNGLSDQDLRLFNSGWAVTHGIGDT